MTLYASDEDGATVCVECLHGLCITRGHICTAQHCRCECSSEETKAVQHRVAAEIEAENYDYARMFAERFGRPA